MGCPGCGGEGTQEKGLPAGIYRCASCGGLFGQCYLGESYGLVRPFMTSESVPEDRLCYFDFTTLGAGFKIERRHGWFDTATRLVVQAG